MEGDHVPEEAVIKVVERIKKKGGEKKEKGEILHSEPPLQASLLGQSPPIKSGQVRSAATAAAGARVTAQRCMGQTRVEKEGVNKGGRGGGENAFTIFPV